MSAKKLKTVTVGEWQAALEQSRKGCAEAVPEGWKTMRQLADEMGVSVVTVNRLVVKLHAVGKVDIKPFIIFRGQKNYPVPHYKLKP